MRKEEKEEGEFDCVILGTGIKESILAGLLSSSGLKILQMDASSIYGSSSRTLRYDEFIREMQGKYPDHSQFTDLLGEEGRSIYVDMTPKIFLADEGLIKIIGENNLSYCIEFSIIGEQYLVNNQEALLIPNTKTSALKSNLCGPFQLVKLHRFMNMIKSYYNASEEEKKKITSAWKSVEEMYAFYGISSSIQVVLGHGVGLYTTDAYLKEEPEEFIMRLTTYFRSVARVSGNNSSKGNSPFLYPKYGISEISQGFARLSAVKGGTTRMSTEIVSMTKEEKGYSMILLTENKEDKISTKHIIANDLYYSHVPNSFKREIHILRGMYVLKGRTTTKSKQALVISNSTCADIFLLLVGSEEGVCPEGYTIGYITGEYDDRRVSVKEVCKNTKEAQEEIEKQTSSATLQISSWKYSVLQSFFWIDSSIEGHPNIDNFITPLMPMDNTVDFRTVHKEVEEVLKNTLMLTK